MEKHSSRKRYHRGRRTRHNRMRVMCLIVAILMIACILATSLATIWSGVHSTNVNATGVSDEPIEVESITIDTDNKDVFKDNPKFEIKLPEEEDKGEKEDDASTQPPIACEECDTHPLPYVSLSSDERYALATLIWLEGRGESVECQYAIGSTVLNRYTTGNYGTLFDVIYEKGQFTPAYLIEESTPTDVQIGIVDELCFHGPTIPEYITYFRADDFHDWGKDFPVPYNYIDNTYFSYDPDIVIQCMEEAGIIFDIASVEE